tara:strand:+ start:92 stop:562 length:471 start_codon:yes stop_codon:yes gene_type:complete
MTELVWYPIYDTDYEITECSKVRRIFKNGKIHYITPSLGNNGYYNITLPDRKKYLIHRILGDIFIPDYNSNGQVIDHINRIRTDNRLENLRWATYKENSYNRELKGSVLPTKDKVKGKYYYGWRATVYDLNSKRISKRFKKEEDAEKWRDENLIQR